MNQCRIYQILLFLCIQCKLIRHICGNESHPPLIVMLEIVRQLSIATCHVHDGIPVAGHAVAGQIHFEWSSAPLSLEQLNSSKCRVLVRSRVVGRNSFCANAISFTMEFMHGWRTVGLGSMSASWTTDREYRILRGHKVFAATTNTNYEDDKFPCSDAMIAKFISC